VDDAVVFSIYKMEVTQKNLAGNPRAWIVAAMKTEKGPRGFRLAGMAGAEGKKLVFTPTEAQMLI
jgi:hypothetical protein